MIPNVTWIIPQVLYSVLMGPGFVVPWYEVEGLYALRGC